MRKILVFIKKGFLETFTYKLSFMGNLFGIFITTFLWFYISKILTGSSVKDIHIYNGGYFSFVIIGIAFSRYVSYAIKGFSESVMREIERGTLESIWVTPTDPFIITLYSSLWNFIYVMFQCAVYLVLGKFIFKIDLYIYNIIPAFFVLFISIISYLSIGIIITSFILLFKRPEPLLSLITVSFAILGGVYFPVSVMPEILQKMSYFLPITYSLHALRMVFIQNAGISNIAKDILYLSLFGIVLLPFSFLLFNYAVKRNKLSGSLIFY